MAVEKFTSKPWHDNPNHTGWHGHKQRLDASDAEIAEYGHLTMAELLAIIDQPLEEPVIPTHVIPQRLGHGS